MSEPSLALQRSIYAKLTTAPTLSGLIGTRVYDRVSPSATFPYVRIGNDQSVAEAQDCAEESVEVFAQIDVFSRNQGKTEAKNIAGAIVRTLSSADLTLESGYELQEIHHASTLFVDDPDGLSTHAIINFRALIETAT